MKCMKKLISVCFIAAMALFMGCSDDNDSGNGSNNGSNTSVGAETYCKKQSANYYKTMVSKNDSLIKAKGLTQEQLQPLQDTLLEDCIGFTKGYPVCNSEIVGLYECDYSDETEKARDAENEKCDAAYQACDRSNDDCEDKFNACTGAIPDFCKKERDLKNTCYNANEQALKNYDNNTDSMPKTNEALKALGIDPKDLEH